MKNTNLHRLHKEIGNKIRVLRKEKKISQQKLATEVDLSKTHIGRIERAEISPTVESLLKITEYFDIEIAYLFTK